MKNDGKELKHANSNSHPGGAVTSDLQANWLTRILYCLALFGITAGQIAVRSSWVAVTVGGLVDGIDMFIFFAFDAILIYRIYLVIRYQASLRARKPNLFGWIVRVMGLLVMMAGAFGTISVFLVKPITLLLLQSAGDNGIGYFVVGVYVVLISRVGWIGCVLFELSRCMGAKSRSPSVKKTPRQRKQDFSFGIALIVVALSVPYLMKSTAVTPCYGPTLTSCVAKVEGGVIRPTMVPYGGAVKLESNIDEIDFIKSREPRQEVIENPTFSLLKSGHPAQDDVASPVRVKLNAVSSSQGVVITLSVFDEKGESAKFITSIPKYGTLESGKDGKEKIVVDLPSYVFWGANSPLVDAETDRRYILDEFFMQMRKAIYSPREFAEWSLRVPGSVHELSAVAVPLTEKIDETTPAVSCVNILKLKRGKNNETEFWPVSGNKPMNRLIFLSEPDPESYVLFHMNDRIGCNSDGVWVYGYSALSGELEIRRYTNEGKLINFVSVILPIEKKKGAWADVDSAKIDGKKITFSLMSGEWKRREYEISF